MSKEAMKLALEALELHGEQYPHMVKGYCLDAITALQEALAEQPAQQEPVAIHQFRSPHCSDWYDGVPDHHDGHGPYEVRTLYTSPPAQRTWVGLTDEERMDVLLALNWDKQLTHMDTVKAIEAKLKEKNNGN